MQFPFLLSLFLDDKETPMVVKIKAAKDMAIRW